MNAEELEIARRLVACPKWVWLPGTAYVSTRRNDKMRRGRLALAPNGGDCFKAAEDWYHGDEFENRDPDDFGKWRWLPDLSDDLTRLGVLAAVRRARNEPNGSLMPVVMKNGRAVAVAYYPIVEGARPFYAPTELAALLAALEAAP